MLTTERTIDLERRALGEVEMLGEERWEEIHRRAAAGASIRAIARELDLDRKTVRRCLRQSEWRPYQRAAPEDTLLAPHATYLRQRAAEVGYSARVLFQELRRRRYEGSYETVKRFVRPLRETSLQAAVTRTRFETPLDRRGERGLDHVAGCARSFRGPVPEARPEPMRHGSDAEFFDQLAQRCVGERPPTWVCGIWGPCGGP